MYRNWTGLSAIPTCVLSMWSGMKKKISFQLEGALKTPFCKIEKSSHFLYSVQKKQKHNEQVSIF